MAYQISDSCVNCGVCESECPAGAISEKNSVRWIDPSLCADCGACESTCPSGAISQA
ncbi:MAG: 4Fe-4S binding protein [Treponema sp.]|jgi:NAD-dependent dihydropyrimidine dehydrogenase PreA subunit|nr:4Fe-4S binding protein [Treponema sp.]